MAPPLPCGPRSATHGLIDTTSKVGSTVGADCTGPAVALPIPNMPGTAANAANPATVSSKDLLERGL
jgi:hypothetical protein